MWLQYEIASVYRNLLYEVKSFFQPEPKVNTGTFHVYHVATSSSCHPPPLLSFGVHRIGFDVYNPTIG